MQIALVLHDYLPDHLGGSELHAHQLAQEWQRRGHQVQVWCTERDTNLPEGLLRQRVFEGVPVFEVIHQREYRQLRESFAPTIQPKLFKQLLAEQRPDLVHFHHLAHWGAECVSLARGFGAAVVATMHDYFPLCQSATLLRPNRTICSEWNTGACHACMGHLPTPVVPEESGHPDEALLYRMRMTQAARQRRANFDCHLAQAHELVSPSKFLRSLYLSAGLGRAEHFSVLGTGYPGPASEPRPVRSDRPLRVGYAGGIYPSKGVHVLVEACARLEPGLVELEVHGALDWFKDYVEELRGLAGSAAVRFMGPYEPKGVDRILQRFDVQVVPSIWYENMPITIWEAFRNAVPLLVSDHGGMAEAVPEGRGGGQFKVGSVRDLARRLKELSLDRSTLTRWAMNRPAVQTLEECADGLERIYARALEAVHGQRGALVLKGRL
jgi:glycosyltransferase involved in cell wall biosynthesis